MSSEELTPEPERQGTIRRMLIALKRFFTGDSANEASAADVVLDVLSDLTSDPE
jgi:hypothetical protein